jgi:hypothetical protein
VHWFNRLGEADMHVHIVLSSFVETLDGRWRRVDSKGLHAAIPAMTERLNAYLIEESRHLGFVWEHRASEAVEAVKLPSIVGFSDELRDAFSQRSFQCKAEAAKMMVDYRAEHGRAPNRVTAARMEASEALRGRPKNEQHDFL